MPHAMVKLTEAQERQLTLKGRTPIVHPEDIKVVDPETVRRDLLKIIAEWCEVECQGVTRYASVDGVLASRVMRAFGMRP